MFDWKKLVSEARFSDLALLMRTPKGLDFPQRLRRKVERVALGMLLEGDHIEKTDVLAELVGYIDKGALRTLRLECVSGGLIESQVQLLANPYSLLWTEDIYSGAYIEDPCYNPDTPDNDRYLLIGRTEKDADAFNSIKRSSDWGGELYEMFDEYPIAVSFDKLTTDLNEYRYMDSDYVNGYRRQSVDFGHDNYSKTMHGWFMKAGLNMAIVIMGEKGQL